MTAALVTISAVGIWFPTTRWLSVSALALLCAQYPWTTVPILVGVGVAFYYFKLRKR